ncbi:MAG: cytochrome c [Hyphomonadaceae bacterium]
MRLVTALLAVALVAACASHEPLSAPAERGRMIAQQNCSSCHAIGAAGESSAPEAPPFRTLSANYRVGTLEEALAEGISVGHPAMPQFEFPPEDVDALIAYLESIQQPAQD